jgi:hypothetical protein
MTFIDDTSIALVVKTAQISAMPSLAFWAGPGNEIPLLTAPQIAGLLPDPTPTRTAGELRRLYRALAEVAYRHRSAGSWKDTITGGTGIGKRAHYHVAHHDQGVVTITEYLGGTPVDSQMFACQLAPARLVALVHLVQRRVAAGNFTETRETTSRTAPSGCGDGWKLVAVNIEPRARTTTYTWSRIIIGQTTPLPPAARRCKTITKPTVTRPDDEAAHLLSLFGRGKRHANDLWKLSGLPLGRMYRTLAWLEAEGKIKRLPYSLYTLTPAEPAGVK